MPKFDYVKAYVDYWAKRKEIKQRQRAELEKELLPLAVNLGEALAEARETINIDDLAATLGRSGKNFIYDMIRTYRANADKPHEVIPTHQGTIEKPERDKPEYTVTYIVGEPSEYHPNDNNTWFVKFSDTEFYSLYVDDDTQQLVTPEAWLGHTKERRLIYKEIINAIERERTTI